MKNTAVKPGIRFVLILLSSTFCLISAGPAATIAQIVPLTDGNVWVYQVLENRETYLSSGDTSRFDAEYFVRYDVKGDTVLNGEAYKVVSIHESGPATPHTQLAFFRTDEKRYERLRTVCDDTRLNVAIGDAPAAEAAKARERILACGTEELYTSYSEIFGDGRSSIFGAGLFLESVIEYGGFSTDELLNGERTYTKILPGWGVVEFTATEISTMLPQDDVVKPEYIITKYAYLCAAQLDGELYGDVDIITSVDSPENYSKTSDLYSIGVFPNPTRSQSKFAVQLDSEPEATPAEFSLELRDNLARTLGLYASGTILPGTQQTIELAHRNLPTGLYWILLRVDGQVQVRAPLQVIR